MEHLNERVWTRYFFTPFPYLRFHCPYIHPLSLTPLLPLHPGAPTLLVQVILGEYSEGFVDPVTGNQRRRDGCGMSRDIPVDI